MIALIFSAALAVHGSVPCKLHPFPSSRHYLDGDIPLDGDVKIRLVGELSQNDESFCVYSYHFWWGGRETSRILVFRGEDFAGYYTLPYSKLKVSAGNLVGESIDGEIEVINLIDEGEPSKSIFFDGDNFSFNSVK